MHKQLDIEEEKQIFDDYNAGSKRKNIKSKIMRKYNISASQLQIIVKNYTKQENIEKEKVEKERMLKESPGLKYRDY